MLSCAACSSSRGGQVGTSLFFPHLIGFSVHVFSDTHGTGPCFSGLYPMYAHMIKQRRKVFGGRKLDAKSKTN